MFSLVCGPGSCSLWVTATDTQKHSYLLASAGPDIFAYGKFETLADDAIHGTVLNIDRVASVLSNNPYQKREISYI